jgi:hypothetical protein
MDRKAASVSRDLGVGLVNRTDGVSRSAGTVMLRSGASVLEVYALEGGLVSMQVRGPVGPGGWIGTGDDTPGVLPLGRVVARSEDEAQESLMRRLRLLGEII